MLFTPSPRGHACSFVGNTRMPCLFANVHARLRPIAGRDAEPGGHPCPGGIVHTFTTRAALPVSRKRVGILPTVAWSDECSWSHQSLVLFRPFGPFGPLI